MPRWQPERDFAGIAATGTPNINSGGTVMINNGTQGRLDVPTVNLNNGGTLAGQGSNHIIGLDAGTTTLNTSGTAAAARSDQQRLTSRSPASKTEQGFFRLLRQRGELPLSSLLGAQ